MAKNNKDIFFNSLPCHFDTDVKERLMLEAEVNFSPTNEVEVQARKKKSRGKYHFSFPSLTTIRITCIEKYVYGNIRPSNSDFKNFSNAMSILR